MLLRDGSPKIGCENTTLLDASSHKDTAKVKEKEASEKNSFHKAAGAFIPISGLLNSFYWKLFLSERRSRFSQKKLFIVNYNL